MRLQVGHPTHSMLAAHLLSKKTLVGGCPTTLWIKNLDPKHTISNKSHITNTHTYKTPHSQNHSQQHPKQTTSKPCVSYSRLASCYSRKTLSLRPRTLDVQVQLYPKQGLHSPMPLQLELSRTIDNVKVLAEKIKGEDAAPA